MADQPLQHPLKDLVIKLNDRNIQRQRENGFTVYTILALVIYVIFSIVDTTPEFIRPDRIKDNIVVLTIVGNYAFSFLYFSSYVLGRKNSGRTKIFPKQDFLTMDVSMAPLLLSFLLLGICNFKSYNLSNSHSIIYIVFGVLLLTNACTPLIIKLRQAWKNRKTVFRVPEFTMLDTKKTRIAMFFLVFYGAMLALPTFFLMLQERLQIDNANIAFAVKYSIHLVGLIYGFNIAFGILQTKNFNKDLEELEKEIFLKNLSNDEIKKDLKRIISVRILKFGHGKECVASPNILNT